MNFQRSDFAASRLIELAKATVWQYLQRPARSQDLKATLSRYLAEDCLWHVGHPINYLEGRDAVASELWEPLLHSFPDIERRTDIFFGGYWDGHLDGGEGYWVCATGHYLGTFSQPWLSIPPTQKPAFLRFGEFYRVVDGKIIEARILFDLPHLIRQSGLELLPPSAGVDVLVPGPADHGGLLLAAQDDDESKRSMDLVMAMIGGLGRYSKGDMGSMSVNDYWHPQMMWYGPSGIGTTRGIDGFQRDHQRPFLHAFPDRKGGNHRARFAEGKYVASTGWPSVKATHLGDYLGTPASGASIVMRVMDWWRRDGDLLVENWVFIDLPHLFLQFGVDLLARLPQRTPGLSGE